MRAPALLRFEQDRFMDELAQTLAENPDGAQANVASAATAVTYRLPAPGESHPPPPNPAQAVPGGARPLLPDRRVAHLPAAGTARSRREPVGQGEGRVRAAPDRRRRHRVGLVQRLGRSRPAKGWAQLDPSAGERGRHRRGPAAAVPGLLPGGRHAAAHLRRPGPDLEQRHVQGRRHAVTARPPGQRRGRARR